MRVVFTDLALSVVRHAGRIFVLQGCDALGKLFLSDELLESTLIILWEPVVFLEEGGELWAARPAVLLRSRVIWITAVIAPLELECQWMKPAARGRSRT